MTNPEPDDMPALLAAAARGEEPAWRELVNRYGRRVFALAKSRCGDVHVAEEITQSVFATVAAKLGGGEYTELGKFEPWLFRVAMNRLRDHVRRARRRPVSSDDGAIEATAAPVASAAADEAALEGLRDAMEQLAPADREIVELRHHGGLSFKQIAELLDEPMGTLLARHHRALKKLREILEGKQDGKVGGKQAESHRVRAAGA
ncbi:MAG: sigma-70 family RNA polymerase sigma factor [Phycisphaerales bacterium]